MDRFWKGIIAGLGGVSPGLSGCVLLIILGLYQQTLEALGTLLVDLRRNLRFLLPLLMGMITGVLLFSRGIAFCLTAFEVPTRYCFLGLILGTLPMVWREIRKEGFGPRYYFLILLAVIGGIWFFTLSPNGFPQVTEPTLVQNVLLGVAVAATAIIPGVDPAVFLSAFGLYELYIRALATLDFRILVPMVPGLLFGAVGISYVMTRIFRAHYTAAFAVIFGIFLSMIPHILTPACTLGLDIPSVAALVLMVLGFALSWFLGDFQNNLQRFRRLRTNEEDHT